MAVCQSGVANKRCILRIDWCKKSAWEVCLLMFGNLSTSLQEHSSSSGTVQRLKWVCWRVSEKLFDSSTVLYHWISRFLINVKVWAKQLLHRKVAVHLQNVSMLVLSLDFQTQCPHLSLFGTGLRSRVNVLLHYCWGLCSVLIFNVKFKLKSF